MVEHKKSIRFFNDHEVRAVWDDERNKWWFSVLDIIAAINEQDDYQKTRNYWKYLKTKLKKVNSELVSTTNQFVILFLQLCFKILPIVPRLLVIVLIIDCCNDIKYRETVLVTFLVLYSPRLATVEDADDFLCYFSLP